MATHIAGSEPGDRNPTHDAVPPRRSGGTLSELDLRECQTVLTAESVGRIGWRSASGQIILPVTYIYIDEIIGFRTSAYGVLSELRRPTEVAFEVDSLDRQHSEAVSVVIQGLTHVAEQTDWSWSPPDWSNIVVPWAGGNRHLSIEISIKKITGRRIRRSQNG